MAFQVAFAATSLPVCTLRITAGVPLSTTGSENRMPTLAERLTWCFPGAGVRATITGGVTSRILISGEVASP